MLLQVRARSARPKPCTVALMDKTPLYRQDGRCHGLGFRVSKPYTLNPSGSKMVMGLGISQGSKGGMKVGAMIPIKSPCIRDPPSYLPSSHLLRPPSIGTPAALTPEPQTVLEAIQGSVHQHWHLSPGLPFTDTSLRQFR